MSSSESLPTRSSRPPRTAAAWLMIVLGAIALVAALALGWRTAAFLSHAAHATAYVSDPTPHPRLRFALADGHEVEFTQNGYVSRPRGAAVPVAYDPRDPAGTAQAATFWASWGTPLGLLWIGLGFVLLPLFGVRVEFKPGRY